MSDLPPGKAGASASKVKLELVSFYDDFVELQDAYAFLSDAITALLRSNAELDGATLEGLCTFSNDAKQSASELKTRLRGIMEKDCAKHPIEGKRVQ